MLILGLNAFHADAAACIVRDGRIVAAAEEERFRRIKHWAGFPAEAIRYCLAAAGATLADVDLLAVSGDPWAGLLRKIGYALTQRPAPDLIRDRLRNQARRLSVEAELGRAFPQDRFGGAVHRVEHHMAHLASAFLVAPFAAASVVSVDGFGDFASAAWGIGRGTCIEIDGRINFPHSLGIFYQALTQYLGFLHYGDEYKVMGLAPCGEPRHMAAMRSIVRLESAGRFALGAGYFRHLRERIDYEWDGGAPHVGRLFSRELEELLGPARMPDEPLTARHRDIACSVQAMYEEALLHLLAHVRATHGLDRLALAGGCAMNSVANGRVRQRSGYEHLYVPPAPGDAGGAVGAALHVWHRIAAPRSQARQGMDHAFLGPAAGDDEIAALVAAHAPMLRTTGLAIARNDEDELCRDAACAIADGAVVGWYQGRMEWGPRALGNRSILADPRRTEMKDVLNARIKRRESFRPFAPSVLAEHAADWFAEAADVPFMTEVHEIRPERRAAVPAVTHVDGSGRLQTVARAANPRYWRLIETFRQLTGVPMLLNTSFNESEPIVCRPEEALACFLRTEMDQLVLGDWTIRRSSDRR